MPPLTHLLALFASGLAAGGVNSIAGGGSLITFPTMLALGIAPIAANATNTVALTPGSAAAFWAYRDTLGDARPLAFAMALPGALGGVVGATLALQTGDATFARLVPWLILGATGLFALQAPLARAVRKHDNEVAVHEAPRGRRLVALAVFQFVVAVYGGFFGAGIGILMLAMLGFLGARDLHRANGLKNLAAGSINAVASLAFVVGGKVVWTHALAVALGAIAGGYGGAGVARKVGQARVRRAVMAIGITMAAVMFVRSR